jgi:8-oxo-dGTP pyrophosphatase MutT (NUDIX family)
MNQEAKTSYTDIRAGAVIVCDKKVLCVHQRASGLWGFPKGMLTIMETPKIADTKMVQQQIPIVPTYTETNMNYEPKYASFASILKSETKSQNKIFMNPNLIPSMSPNEFPQLSAAASAAKPKPVLNYTTLNLEKIDKIVPKIYDAYTIEKIKDAVIREIKEEVGISLCYQKLNDSNLIIVYSSFYYVVKYYFRPEVIINDSNEIASAMWFSLSELSVLNTSNATKRVINQLKRLIN